MIMCIDSTKLKRNYNVQKDVKLEDLLLNHTKFYTSSEEAYKDLYVPLDFAVTVRSMYSNKVLQIKSEEGYLYYTNLADIPRFVHRGYDLVMYLASIAMLKNINYRIEYDELMFKHSQFNCIGLFNPLPEVINPKIYSHIILSDECLEEFSTYLKEGREMIDISDMKTDGNYPSLIKEIIEVNENAENDND